MATASRSDHEIQGDWIDMAISELIDVIPPPSRAFNTGTDDQWRRAEAEFGFPFPSDLRDLLRTYGTGVFYDQLFIDSPACGLLQWAQKRIEWIRSYIEESVATEHCTWRFYPDPGGLFPIGQEENGSYVIHWEMSGAPDEWRIVVLLYGEDVKGWEYDGNLTSFLSTLFRGKFPCEGITPQDMDELQPFRPVADWPTAT